jgi:hypothetical protein
MNSPATWLLVSAVIALLLWQSGGYSAREKRIARAIGVAEGFDVPGSLAQRSHNPGNLTRIDGTFYVFATDSEGWNALYAYVKRMLSGEGLYSPGSTIYDASRIYTATEQDEWALNVAASLGVSVYTPLVEV